MLNTNNQFRGFTLIELMLTMSLALLFVSVLTEIYLANHRSLQLQNSLIQIQQNSITVISMLKNELQLAGYIGCAKLAKDFPIISHTNYSISINNKIHGTDNEITVVHAAFLAATVKLATKNSSQVIVDKAKNFNIGDILLISDCKHAEILQVKNITVSSNSQQITLNDSLQFQYDSGAEMSILEINSFFVAKTKRKYKNGLPVFALFMRDISHHTYELVENINQLEFSYTLDGIDVHASEISDWSKVQGIETKITIRSDEVLSKKYYSYVMLS